MSHLKSPLKTLSRRVYESDGTDPSRELGVSPGLPETRKNRPDLAISTTTEGPVSQISAKVPCANELAALETWLVDWLADMLVADYLRTDESPTGTDREVA